MADWRWPWEAAPAAEPDPGPPVPPASAAKTPTQNAQAVIDRYWQWANAGAATTALDKDGNPVADNDGKAVKDQKTGALLKYAVDPITGQVDQNFPTVADITAARAEVTAKMPNDPAAAKQAEATLNETLARTAQIQATMAAKPTKPNVTPGEGVWDPTANGGAGGYTVPVPTKPDKPTAPPQSQAQVDTAATDVHNQAVAATNRDNVAAANTESPEAAHARRMSEINQTAKAQGDALVAAAKAKVDAGLEMTEQDKLQLQSALDGIKSDHDAAIATSAAQFTHDLAQPNAAIEQGVAQQNADTSRQNADTSAATQQSNALSQQNQAQQANVNEQVTALTSQAAQGQANVDRVVKAGSAVPMSAATFRMSTQPLELAFQLAHQAIATGGLPPTALPTPNGAPQPAAATAGPPTAPLPAPGVVAATQPTAPLLPAGVAGTAADPRYASVMPPHGAY